MQRGRLQRGRHRSLAWRSSDRLEESTWPKLPGSFSHSRDATSQLSCPDLTFSDLSYLSRIPESRSVPYSVYQVRSSWSQQTWLDPYRLEPHDTGSRRPKSLTRQTIHSTREYTSLDLQPNSNSRINRDTGVMDHVVLPKPLKRTLTPSSKHL